MVSIENGPNIASPASSRARRRRLGVRAFMRGRGQAGRPSGKPGPAGGGESRQDNREGGALSRTVRAAGECRGAPPAPRYNRIGNPEGEAARACRERVAAEGANARNRSGPIPPVATTLWRDRPASAGTGAEGARSAACLRFQTLRQKDRGAPARARAHA